MKLRFLGTGTSNGVPQIGCHCPTCLSTDSHDKRMRASALLTTDTGQNILIDCGPDFYHQIIRAGAPPLDALLVTHIHYDHVGGMDDLRPYCAGGAFPVYCSTDVHSDLRQTKPYSFATHLYPGVPTYGITHLEPLKPIDVAGITVTPVPILHYKLPILGFKFGERLAYVTDCKTMPQETVQALKGVDTLVINALRHKEHLSHLNLQQALELVKQINPRVTYLTHMSHDIGKHEQLEASLPPGVYPAYDGLEIRID